LQVALQMAISLCICICICIDVYVYIFIRRYMFLFVRTSRVECLATRGEQDFPKWLFGILENCGGSLTNFQSKAKAKPKSKPRGHWGAHPARRCGEVVGGLALTLPVWWAGG
jgi:hypothetical protein